MKKPAATKPTTMTVGNTTFVLKPAKVTTTYPAGETNHVLTAAPAAKSTEAWLVCGAYSGKALAVVEEGYNGFSVKLFRSAPTAAGGELSNWVKGSGPTVAKALEAASL